MSEYKNDITTVGFWKRFLAMIIDGILCIPWGIYVIFSEMNSPYDYIFVIVFGSCFLIIYNVYFVHRFGGTIGKILLRIQITDYAYEKLSIVSSLKRYLPYIILEVSTRIVSIVVIIHAKIQWEKTTFTILNKKVQDNIIYILLMLMYIGWLIGEFISLTTDIEDKTLHDRLAKSIVIRRVRRSVLNN